MDSSEPVCPICMLTVRRDIPLSVHLDTHPKDILIRTLVTRYEAAVANSSSSSSQQALAQNGSSTSPTTYQYIHTTNHTIQNYPYNFFPMIFPYAEPHSFLCHTPRPHNTVQSLSFSISGAAIAGSSPNINYVQLAQNNVQNNQTQSVAVLDNSREECDDNSREENEEDEDEEDEEEEVEEDEDDDDDNESMDDEEPLNLADVLEVNVREGNGVVDVDKGSKMKPNNEKTHREHENEVQKRDIDKAQDDDDHDEHEMNIAKEGSDKSEVSSADKKHKSDKDSDDESEDEDNESSENESVAEEKRSDHGGDDTKSSIDIHCDDERSIESPSPSPVDDVSVRDIQTDETMPPQGELSEAESLGGVDTSSLWGPAAEDVFSEVTNRSTANPLLCEWNHLSMEHEVLQSSEVNSCPFQLSSLQCDTGKIPPIAHTSWTTVDNKHLMESPEADKLLLGEESILVQQSDSRRQRTCGTCQERFQTLRELKIHCQKEHKGTVYKCVICQKEFSSRNEFLDHNKQHTLECLKCGKLFPSRAGLRLHMKRHLNLKSYSCEFCDKAFITRQKLTEHLNGHTGNKPYLCTVCDKQFKRYSNLVQHRKYVHLKVRKPKLDLLCNQCGKIFHSKKSLEWHIETHLEVPHVCKKCPQRFLHSSSLTRHMRFMHDIMYMNNKHQNNVMCPTCNKVICKTSMQAHLRTHSGEKPYCCNICHKRFSTKWNLEQHRWTHAGISNKPLRCTFPNCKLSYSRKEDLESHVRSHKNKKPFTCDECGRMFARRSNCLRHFREHKNVKGYDCSVCNKKFYRAYYLSDHMKIHTGIRPFTCHICGKASTTKSNHNKHIKTHHARETVTPEG